MKKVHETQFPSDTSLDNNTLPEGWVFTPLKEVVNSIKGKKPKKLHDRPRPNAIPYIDIQAFESGYIRRYADPNSSTIAEEGDIVVVWDGARCGLAGKLPTRGAVGSTLTTLKHYLIESDYLMYFLVSYYDIINSNPRGIGIPHVEPEIFWNLNLPLAPLSEQKRIVERLNKMLTMVKSEQDRLAKVLTTLKRFRQAVLAAACSGRLTTDWRDDHLESENGQELIELIRIERKRLWSEEIIEKGRNLKTAKFPKATAPNPDFDIDVPESWAIASMDELTSRITSGSRAWKRFYCDDGPGTFIMAQNVRPVLFDMSYRVSVDPPEKDPDRMRSEVRQNDILVTIAGNTGDVCRVAEPVEQHYVCQSVALMRPVIKEISSFLELYLNSPDHGQDQYSNWVYGEGRPHLSFKHLRETAVLLPPLKEQQEIVRRVRNLFQLADRIKRKVESAQTRAEKLTQAIIAKAFRGELVPTEAALARREGRDYEPASVLLDRIQAQRAAEKIKKTHKKGKIRRRTA